MRKTTIYTHLHDDELHELRLKYEDIEKRVSLPWKPKDLRDHLIVFRRRQGNSDNYVSDLRVRKDMVSRILTLLTTKGFRGPGHEHEPLHQYYGDIEWSQEDLDALPEDDVPPETHIQDFDEDKDACVIN